MRRAALLAAAAVMYVSTAWMVSPGFYDGFGPSSPYAWTCPPAQAGANTKPTPGHAVISVIGGVSDAGDAFTNDGQVVIGFLPGAFNAAGKTTIDVDIAPTTSCPQPAGVRFVTNIYQITANAPLVKPSNLTMVYSNLEPAPSAIYSSTSVDGPWTSLGASPQAQPFTIWIPVRSLGYFAAGYPAASPPPGTPTVGGGQSLPLIVGVLIAVVILAGLPLAVLRRRRSADGEEEDEG
ncbi:MAG TPA: transmembrane domain-containing protein [Candidatus Udaeobacter sp.]|nr:transmembrane domain-containing protein [Candidatus Udaeobacter sp.]